MVAKCPFNRGYLAIVLIAWGCKSQSRDWLPQETRKPMRMKGLENGQDVYGSQGIRHGASH